MPETIFWSGKPAFGSRFGEPLQLDNEHVRTAAIFPIMNHGDLIAFYGFYDHGFSGELTTEQIDLLQSYRFELTSLLLSTDITLENSVPGSV